MEIQDGFSIGRISAVADDGETVWIETLDAGVAIAQSPGGWIELDLGDVVSVNAAANALRLAPPELWPDDRGEHGGGRWVGVVKLIHEDETVVDIGTGVWRIVPTNEVEVEIGNTVVGTDSTGVSKVLSEDPIQWREPASQEGSGNYSTEPDSALTFDDFGGLPEVVARARELIEVPLTHQEELKSIGSRPIKGVLFTGEPGTGKTMLARIIASASGAHFYEVSGPTVFSKWFGESEGILRRIFEEAEENAPSIIFFDEIDSVAGQRSEDAHEASKRVVAQLLTLMDGFSPTANVTVIAATNRPQDIDVALLRPGRFDWQIEFPLPNIEDRREILEVNARTHATSGELPHAWVASRTEGWSAAELAAVFSEAALLAAVDHRGSLLSEDYLEGFRRVDRQRQRSRRRQGADNE